MTTLTLVQNLLDTDISAIPSPSLAMDTVNQFSSTLSSGILDGIVSDYTVKGSKLIYKDPVFSNGGSEYQFRGSIVANLNSNGDATSASFNLQMPEVATNNGVLSTDLIIKGSANASGYTESVSMKKVSFKGDDGSRWTLSGSQTLNVKYNSNTDVTTSSNSESYSSYSASDVNGNSVIFSGNIKYNQKTETMTGSITGMTLTIEGTKYNSGKLQLNYDDLKAMTFSNVDALLPMILSGDDVISISNEYISEINGYMGNDKIVGSKNGDFINGNEGKDTLLGGDGDDTMAGGAGIDKLTGGKGADIFTFNTSDFWIENAAGDQVYNKSVDIVTDFNPLEGDVLKFVELGGLGFYPTVAAAKITEASLFYSGGKIYLNTDTTGEKFIATPIITLTGNQKSFLNADGDGWAESI
jgi:Ca2+-binding RTX toxin-like protein